MTTREMVKKVADNVNETKLYSKVTTNRNWVICLRNIKTDRYVWEACKMKDADRMCHSFEDIAKYDIKYFFFTYKKDFVKMLHTLKDSNNYRFLPISEIYL